MRQLSISSFGALTFSLDGHPLEFDYDKVRALLLLLALQPDHAQTRAALCALLWPDASEHSARTSLSQALTRLRKAIPADAEAPFLISTSSAVQINPACDVEIALDSDRFERFLNEAEAHPHRAWKTCARCTERLTEAAAVYNGDFLSEFSLPDSAPFEEWAQGWRESLRQRALTMHERIARRYEWCGDWTGAICHAQRQIEIDPLNEACHRELMRLYVVSDQASAAHHHYEALRQRLSDELGVEPDPATQQLYTEIASSASPKLLRDTAPVSRLPEPPSMLIGRDADVANACDLLREHDARLITLTGPGGVGKTRLALRVAEEMRYDYLDGAYFVELAGITSSILVNAAVADALGLQEQTADAVIGNLSRLHALLVLDNFEHVMGAAPFVADLVARSAGITVLVTSRVALRIRAERVVPLAPLSVPIDGAGADEIGRASSVQLFVERARAVQPAFRLTPENIADVAAICRRLDGLPLALELVAIKTATLTPADIIQQLQPSLPALADGPRDLPMRQQTMSDAIRWSTRLLSDPERHLFAHLAVFAGSFDVDAAQAVCPHAEKDLLALSRASLIQPVSRERWRMLEPIREFAVEMLAQLDDTAPARASHAAHFSAIARSARDALLGPDATTWMTRLEADHANMQVAIDWALRTGQPDIALTIGQGIFRFWFRRGLWREGLARLEQAPVLNSAPSATSRDIWSNAFRAAGALAHTLSRFQHADRHYQSAMRFAYQADTLQRLGRFDEAKILYRKALALNKKIGDEEGIGHALRGLGEIAWREGDADMAERLLLDNEVICGRSNQTRALSWTAQQLGNIACLRGEWHKAHAHYIDALEQMEKIGDQWGMCEVLVECAHVAAAQHDYERAAQWIGMAQAGWRALGAKLTPYEQGLIDATIRQCARHLADATLQLALQHGAAEWVTSVFVVT